MTGTAERESNVVRALDQLYEFEREPVSEDRLQPDGILRGLSRGACGGHGVRHRRDVRGVGVNAYDIFVGLRWAT